MGTPFKLNKNKFDFGVKKTDMSKLRFRFFSLMLVYKLTTRVD